MPLIPEFEYDIFISYSHVDNEPFPGQNAGWIEQFYKNLDLMLAKRFGRMGIVKIWWDNKKLDGSKLFDRSIEEGIKKSAIMICLNSPGYMQSVYCNQELDLFHKKAQAEKAGLRIGDRLRIFNVLLNNIPFKDWPKELSGTSGFPFHDAKEADDFGDTLDANSTEFRNQMQNLRDAIWYLLSDFSTNKNTNDLLPPDKTVIEPTDFFTIYMGEVADTLRTPRKRVITELEKKGYNVVHGVPPPDETIAHENATKDALKEASLSIHLLDEYPGREIIGLSQIGYPQKQTQIALDLTKPQMIWVPAETDFENIEDEKYKHFLQGLETHVAPTKTYEFVRGSKSRVAQEIIDMAEQLRRKPSPPRNLSVLLDTHYNDQIYALDLSKTLLQNQIQPFINPQEDDPRKNIHLLSDRISQVKKMIFLYGSVSKEWVLERMSAALQIIITNNYPIEDFFIYLAPPHKKSSDITLKQKFLRVKVVDSSDGESADKMILHNFLRDLKADLNEDRYQ